MKKVNIVVGLCLALLVIGAGNGRAFFGFGKYTAVTAENGVVSIPADEVDDGEAHFYSFGHQGAEVKFFLLRSSDGVIRAAFDACDVCFPEGKGYSRDGDFMVCNNCGQRFHSARINEVRGGCNPSPLGRAVENGRVILKVQDIAAGAGYFK